MYATPHLCGSLHKCGAMVRMNGAGGPKSQTSCCRPNRARADQIGANICCRGIGRKISRYVAVGREKNLRLGLAYIGYYLTKAALSSASKVVRIIAGMQVLQSHTMVEGDRSLRGTGID